MRSISAVLTHTNVREDDIIVIDNASSDGTPDIVADTFPHVLSIRNAVNEGFAKACNQAVALSSTEYVVLLNTDCFLRNDAFGEMLRYLESHPDVGIVGARLSNSDRTPQGSCRQFVSITNEFLATLPYLNKLPCQCFHRDLLSARSAYAPMIVDYVSGACFMFRRATFDKIGGFDERFFMYSEEEDFCYRARQAGYKTVYLPSADAIHVGGASFGEHIKRRSALVANSRLKYYKKHHSPLQVVAFRATLSLALVARTCFGIIASVFPSARSRARVYSLDALVTLRTYLSRTV
jgi:GT2 family glycosyltransferase